MKFLKTLLKFGPKTPDERLVDFSQKNFLEWHREREKHLQMIDMLKEDIKGLRAERDMWMREAMSNARRGT